MSFSESNKQMIVLAATAVLVLLCWQFRIVQIHYPKVIENNPLRSPRKVESISGRNFVLEDGRTFESQMSPDDLKEFIRESGFQLDIEHEAGDSYAVYYKHRGWLCGTPWAGLIAIPLIPDNVPINSRKLMTFAKAINQSRGK